MQEVLNNLSLGYKADVAEDGLVLVRVAINVLPVPDSYVLLLAPVLTRLLQHQPCSPMTGCSVPPAHRIAHCSTGLLPTGCTGRLFG